MKSHPLLSRVPTVVAGIVALALLHGAAGVAESPHPDISFIVHKLKEENVEGPDMERTYFMAAGKRMVFGEPTGCRVGTEDGGFVLLLTDGLDGEIHVSRSTFTPELDLARNALKYRSAASASVPAGATNLEVQPPTMNPYPYNGWKSLGFTWTYSLSGRSMVRTVSYINLEVGVQVVVTTLAAKSDAEKVEKIAKQFMSSWWVIGG